MSMNARFACLKFIVWSTLSIGGLAQNVDAQSSPSQYNEWQGFLLTSHGSEPLKLRFGGHPSARIITGSFSAPDFQEECNVVFPELTDSITFRCSSNKSPDQSETIKTYIKGEEPSVMRMFGQLAGQSFVLCPISSDQSAVKACLADLAMEVDNAKPSTIKVQNPHPPSERIRAALPRIENAFVTLKTHGVQVPPDSETHLEFMRLFYTQPGKVPARYADTLEYMAQLLTDAAETPENPDNQPLVTDIADNLQIMYTSSKPLSALPSTEDQQIKISTMKGKKEVSGWEIFYMEYFFRNVRHPIGPDSFPKPSSPTEHRLPPGRYIMQAVNAQSGKRSEPKNVVVNNKSVDYVIEVK